MDTAARRAEIIFSSGCDNAPDKSDIRQFPCRATVSLNSCLNTKTCASDAHRDATVAKGSQTLTKGVVSVSDSY